MTNLVLDLLILAVIALFALLGWHKGLVLTLCGVLVIFVAYFGAAYVSETFSDDLAELIQPTIQNQLDLVVEQAMPSDDEPSYAPFCPRRMPGTRNRTRLPPLWSRSWQPCAAPLSSPGCMSLWPRRSPTAPSR